MTDRRVRRTVRIRAEDVPPGTRRLVRVGGREIGVFNIAGRYHAVNNVCPHAGAPLCAGPLSGTTESVPGSRDVRWVRDGEVLRCPWHGWEFDVTSGETVTAPVIRARTYRVTMHGDELVVEL